MNDQIGIGVIAAGSGDVHGLSYSAIAVILVLILSIGFISSRAFRARNLSVHHLFLKIPFSVNRESHTGYIRKLDDRSAVLVSSIAPEKGSEMTLELCQLPNFPKQGFAVKGRVKKVQPLGGQPSNFLVSIEFDIGKKDYDRQPLHSYIRHLTA